MKCPKCGKEMEEGFVSAGFNPPDRGIGWSSTKGQTAIDLQPLLGTDHWYQNFAYAKAFRCKSCKLVQFEY